jgi:2,3-bisphosphoglycerate-independent phosphoglycerate mutase
MNRPTPTIIFLGDGMADEPLPELNGATPLEYAQTPAMDAIARAGQSGSLLTLPEGFPTSSEVANMSVLGCDLATEYCGRGPLEAAGRGLPLGPGDITFRLNLTSQTDGMITDYSGGHIDPEDARVAVQALNEAFGSEEVHFYTGVSYRTLLVLSGNRFSARVKTEKPDDHQGDRVDACLPKSLEPAGQATALWLADLMRQAPTVLESLPFNLKRQVDGLPLANGVWPWSGGKAGALKSIQSKYGISGAVISAVDVIVGLGRCLGMEVISVPGATGYIDTNFEGKAEAAIRALSHFDLVYLHLEAVDEVSHEGRLDEKIRAIENFDRRIIAPVLAAFDPAALNAVVLPDHPVPVKLRKHTRTPVPVAVRKVGWIPDAVMTYGEKSCLQGQLRLMRGDDLMRHLFLCGGHTKINQ